jgi:hypothetical protein
VDAILCCLQVFVEKISSVRFRALPMRLGVGRRSRSQFRCVGGEQAEGVGIAVAKLIEFYVPEKYRPRVLKVLPEGRGEVIEFRPRTADESDADKESLWRKFTLLPLRSASIDGPGR